MTLVDILDRQEIVQQMMDLGKTAQLTTKGKWPAKESQPQGKRN